MGLETPLTRLLGISLPIIQAPMAGGPTTPELVAAVSNAGALGSLGAGYMSPDAIRAAVRRIRELTDKPFAVNLFVPESVPDDEATRSAVAEMKDYLATAGPWDEHVADEIRHMDDEAARNSEFDAQLQVLLEERVPVFSFTFGCPSAETLQTCRKAGMTIVGTACSVEEALFLERAGVDAIIAQGYEAGGHRGAFLKTGESSMVGLVALVPQVVDAVQLPVIAAGAIMDGRGIAACLALGAAGVQLGTAFLAATESGAHPAYRQALLAESHAGSSARPTVLTRAFSGKPARGLRNTFIDTLESTTGRTPAAAPVRIPPYPIQNALTRPIRNWAAREGNAEYMSLWAGQGVQMVRTGSAADIIQQLAAETEAVVRKLSGDGPSGAHA